MKVTNKENMPSGFYNACKNQYVRIPGSYSVTELLKGSTAILLERRHGDEVEVDCSEMVWMIFGNAVHKVMEESTVGDMQFSEMPVSAKFLDVRVSGHIDLYDAENGVVCDYKTCSVWKVIFGDYDDWRMQLLAYSWLLRESGFEAKRGMIVALMKDFSKRDSQQKNDYPALPVKRIIFDFTEKDFDEYESFLTEKFRELAEYDKLASEDLPPCSPKERWAKPDTFAVKKKGRKTALRVLDTKEAAEAWMEEKGGDEIETRKGVDVKCKDYCSVCEHCSYWKENYGGE